MATLTTYDLTAAIKHETYRLGFDHCRITPVTPAPHADFFDGWLARGRAGEMAYLARSVDRRRDPRLLAGAGQPEPHSIVALAVDYGQASLPDAVRRDPSRGVIASYAWGDDYHEVIRPRLYELDAFIRRHSGRSSYGICLVDSGPVLERDWAQRAGVGFFGKNCCLIQPGRGSWHLLATLLVPEVLAYDAAPTPVDAGAFTADDVLDGLAPDVEAGAWRLEDGAETRLGTCGRCARCLDACPTAAFVGPYHLDPTRCISYWTIEARTAIPRELRPRFGNHIFGCDICQEVCPWNQRLPARRPRLPGLQAQPARMAPPLLDGFTPDSPYWVDEAAFRSHFRRSPVKRAKRAGMLRNVCVALGNWADPAAVPALCTALADPDPLPRGHAAWALGCVAARHKFAPAVHALAAALNTEADPWVRQEITLALDAADIDHRR